MEEATARKFRFVTIQIVGAVAMIHLVVGGSELLRISQSGLLWAYFSTGQALVQPEPWLFVLSSVAIFLGIVATATGRLSYRRAYLLGIGIMAVYILAWLAWHTVLDHGTALAGAAETADGQAHGEGGEHTQEDNGHAHDGLLTVLRSHYVSPLVGAVTGADQPGQATLVAISKTLEAIAVVLLAVLLRFDPRIEES